MAYYRTIVPRHGIGSSIAILSSGYRSVLTVVPFTVPQAGPILPVSGGGFALAGAVSAASPGDTILITDSLNYSPVTVTGPKMDVTVMADVGQTPTITATPGAFNHCFNFLGGGFLGFALKGLTFIGSGNGGGGSLSDTKKVGLVHFAVSDGGGTPFQRLIIEDCIFTEPAATATMGAAGLMLIGNNTTACDNVWIHRCSFMNTGALTVLSPAAQWGACTIGSFQNVYIQNCKIIRQNAVIAAALSKMKGVVLKNADSIVEDVLCESIGLSGLPEAFLHTDNPELGANVGVSNFANCVAYNCRIGYSLVLTGATLNVARSVYDADVLGIAGGTVMRRLIGTYTTQNSVMTSATDGITFSAAGITEDHNDVFNFASTGKVLDATDLTIDPLYQDVPNRIFRATAVPLQTGASDGGLIGVRYGAGEKIFWVGTPLGT